MTRPLNPLRVLPLVSSLAVALLASTGCEQPNPLAQADPIGEYPQWGIEFQKPAADTDNSLVLAGTAAPEGPVPSGEAREGQQGGSAVPAKNPMATESWSGGDPALGKTVYLNNCALCHGAAGRGGNKMGMTVPTLRNPGWHDKVDDNHIASTVSHGKGKMPSFMGKLDKAQLSGLVAFVRTLKANPAAAAPPAATSQPAKAAVPKETPKAPAADANKEAAEKADKNDDDKKEDDGASLGEGW